MSTSSFDETSSNNTVTEMGALRREQEDRRVKRESWNVERRGYLAQIAYKDNQIARLLEEASISQHDHVNFYRNLLIAIVQNARVFQQQQ